MSGRATPLRPAADGVGRRRGGLANASSVLAGLATESPQLLASVEQLAPLARRSRRRPRRCRGTRAELLASARCCARSAAPGPRRAVRVRRRRHQPRRPAAHPPRHRPRRRRGVDPGAVGDVPDLPRRPAGQLGQRRDHDVPDVADRRADAAQPPRAHVRPPAAAVARLLRRPDGRADHDPHDLRRRRLRPARAAGPAHRAGQRALLRRRGGRAGRARRSVGARRLDRAAPAGRRHGVVPPRSSRAYLLGRVPRRRAVRRHAGEPVGVVGHARRSPARAATRSTSVASPTTTPRPAGARSR